MRLRTPQNRPGADIPDDAGAQRRTAARIGRALARLCLATEAATAVEFAFVTPVLMMLFMAAIEVPRAIATQNRLAQATATMADLISRQDQTRIEDVFAAAQVVAAPYNVSGLRIVLTAGGIYQGQNSYEARVCSSVQKDGTARTVGSTIEPVLHGAAFKGDRFVMAETTLAYRPLFSFFPVLNGLSFTGKTVWPVREGIAYNGQPEVVLPGGRPCSH